MKYVDITLVTTGEGFASLREEWNRLLEKTGSPNFFLCHEWLYTWWETFAADGKLYILLCREKTSGGLLGILPCYIETVKGFPAARLLKFIGSSWTSSDFLEGIVSCGSEHYVYGEMFDFLAANRNDWDVVNLTDIEHGSELSTFLASFKGCRRIDIQVDKNKRCPYLCLPSNRNELLKKLSAKTRRNLSSYRRSLDRAGEVKLLKITSGYSADYVFDEIQRLRTDRLESRGYASPLDRESYRGYHKRLFEKLIDKNSPGIFFLQVDGSNVAFAYCYESGKRVFFYQTAFSSDWNNYSVGFVLHSYMIEHYVENGFEIMEFLRGTETYKYKWCDRERQLVDFNLYGNSAAGAVHRTRLIAGEALKKGMRKVCPDGMINFVRKLVHAP